MLAEPATDAVSTPTAWQERQASWLELFFDLVLVAAVAALASQLHEDHSLKGLAVFAGLFVPVWWAWWGFTRYSSAFMPTTQSPALRYWWRWPVSGRWRRGSRVPHTKIRMCSSLGKTRRPCRAAVAAGEKPALRAGQLAFDLGLTKCSQPGVDTAPPGDEQRELILRAMAGRFPDARWKTYNPVKQVASFVGRNHLSIVIYEEHDVDAPPPTERPTLFAV